MKFAVWHIKDTPSELAYSFVGKFDTLEAAEVAIREDAGVNITPEYQLTTDLENEVTQSGYSVTVVTEES